MLRTLDSFKQKKLCFQFVKVISVEKEDEVAEGVSKHGADHQVPSSINVRPWTREYGQDERDDGLDDVVVGLQLRHVLLHLVLFLLVLLDFVTDLFGDVQVDFADFLRKASSRYIIRSMKDFFRRTRALRSLN